MAPTFQPGDTLLGWRWFRPHSGQVVVARHNHRPLIKRIDHVASSGIWLEGDNLARSTDSRQFGYLQSHQLEALIVFRLGRG
jgi:hypothetical protein